MDIRVGGPMAIGTPGDKASTASGAVEAKVLAVRQPRKRKQPISGTEQRRESSAEPDPATGRVLVLLIPDGSRLPAGIESGGYRVFLRFARR